VGSRDPVREPTRLRTPKGARRHPDRPVMPHDLSAEAQKVWRGVLREMGETGIIQAVDGLILRIYCEAVARYVYAAVRLAATGPLVSSHSHARRGDFAKNPLHQIVRDDAHLVLSLARELGLSPGARAGLRVRCGCSDGGMFAEIDRSLPPLARTRLERALAPDGLTGKRERANGPR